MSNSKPAPVDHVRLGAISAAIWANAVENGVRYGVTFERLYRDPKTQEWKSSSTFNRDDLLTLAKVADLAHSRIHSLQTAAKNRDRGEPDEPAPVENEPTPPAPVAGGASASASSSRVNGKARARDREAAR